MPDETPPSQPNEQLVDADNPWPGLSAFTEKNSPFFHGREDETNDLYQLVQRKTLTIFLGQSGLGKTSLLQAGLFPQLRRDDFLPIYIRLDFSEQAPDFIAQIKKAIRLACQNAPEAIDGPAEDAGESLWEFFHREENDFWTLKNRLLTPILVFDQFEEIFTLGTDGPRRQEGVARLLIAMAELIENRPPESIKTRTSTAPIDRNKNFHKVILSLRDDFLAPLLDLQNQIPSVLQNRLHLKKMNGIQALEVVIKAGGNLVDSNVAEKIVLFVGSKEKPSDDARRESETQSSRLDELAALEIEPTLLSVVCRELNIGRQQAHGAKITANLLVGSRDLILSSFYTRALKGLNPQIPAFIEEKLLTSSGFRNTIAYEDAIENEQVTGITPEVILALIDRRLLRFEYSSRRPRLELTHDVLTDVIKKSRDERRQVEAAASLAKKEAELRQSRRRNRILQIACAAALIFALLSLLATYFALKEQHKVDLSLQQADGLIDFMIYNLRDNLEPIGQLKVLDATAARVLAYQTEGANSPALQSRMASALNFQGDVLMSEGKLADAETDYKKALGILQNLLAGDPTNDEFKADLVSTYYGLGSIYFAENGKDRLSSAQSMLQQAIDMAGTIKNAESNDRLTRVLAHAYQCLGQVLTQQSDYPNALENYRKSQPLLQKLVDKNPDVSQWRYEMAANEHQTGLVYYQQDDYNEAQKCYQASIKILQGILKDQGDDARTKFELSDVLRDLGDVYDWRNDEKDALDVYAQSTDFLFGLTKQDPDNKMWLQHLTLSYISLGTSYFHQLDLSHALANFQLSSEHAAELAKLDSTDGHKAQAIAEHAIGDVLGLQGQFDQAIKMQSASLDIIKDIYNKTTSDTENEVDLANGYLVIGDLYYLGKKDPNAATDFYKQGMQIRERITHEGANTENAMHHSEFAWELCTNPMAAFRNGSEAVAEVTTALQKLRSLNAYDDRIADTEAAAYAEAGDFDQAIDAEQRALKQADASGGSMVAAFQRRLTLYRQHKPFHRNSMLDYYF